MTERLALVTGGGSGIGAAIARAASRAGYRVAIMDAQADAAEAMARELGHAVALPLATHYPPLCMCCRCLQCDTQ